MEKTIKLNSNEEAIAIYGRLDENLRFVENEYKVRISARNRRLRIVGDKSNVEKANRFFQDQLKEYRQQKPTKGKKKSGASSVHIQVSGGSKSGDQAGDKSSIGGIHYNHRGKIIRARTKNQRKYLEAMRDCDIVFAIGQAGTGKTYLAMAAAIEYLKKKFVSRIILTRPAVEAGESLGFLPGDLQEKVNPYLRPLYDALHDMMDYEEAAKYLTRGAIEVAPLAYMRGRTLNDAFVILDEAQNTSHAQMKMFLTRLGEASKAVVTGDITQIDLPEPKKSGLIEAKKILSGIKGIKFAQFDKTDVVRHPLVREIIAAYEKVER